MRRPRRRGILRIGPAPRSGTLVAVAVAAAVAIGVVTRSWVAVAVAAAVTGALARPRRRRRCSSCVLAGGGAVRSAAVVGRPRARPPRAVPRLGDRSSTSRSATRRAARVILEVEGERYELWVRGRARQLRVATWRAGDLVLVSGERTPLDDDRRGRVAWQHVVGDLRGRRGSATSAPAAAVAVASNRVRALIERGAGDAAGRPGGAGPGARHRRRPRPAAGDGRSASGPAGWRTSRPSPGRTWRFVLAAAGPLLRARPPVRPVGADAGADRLVRRAHAGRAVGPAGRDDGRARRHRVRPRPPARAAALARRGRRRPAARRPAAGLVGRVLAVGRGHGRRHRHRAVAGRPAGTGSARWPCRSAVTLGAQVGVALPSLLVFGRLSLVGTRRQPRRRAGRRARDALRPAGLPRSPGPSRRSAPRRHGPGRCGASRWVDAVATVGAAARTGARRGRGSAGWLLALGVVAAVGRGRDGGPAAMMAGR